MSYYDDDGVEMVEGDDGWMGEEEEKNKEKNLKILMMMTRNIVKMMVIMVRK